VPEGSGDHRKVAMVGSCVDEVEATEPGGEREAVGEDMVLEVAGITREWE
jgi:hypothetical protein